MDEVQAMILWELPPPRKEWQCGEYYEYGEKKFRDDGCEQWIYQSTTRKFESGKGMVLNARDGPGGLKEERHMCPKRVGSKWHTFENVNIRSYDYHQQHYPCTCGAVFNKEVYPICPTCMRLECRKCSNRQNWVVGKGLDCFLCGARCDPISVRLMEDMISDGG